MKKASYQTQPTPTRKKKGLILDETSLLQEIIINDKNLQYTRWYHTHMQMKLLMTI